MNASLRPAFPAADTPGARAFRLTIEYDGTRYAGWQRQSNAPSVQQTLEEAMERLLRHPARCPGAGRTDAGVHALGQTARVITTLERITADGVRRGGNTALPADVRIVGAEECDLGFDPRRDARRRWYRYSLFCRSSPPALARGRVWHIHQAVDWDKVGAALALLCGRHDFRAFRSSACAAKRTVLTLERAEHSVAPGPEPIHHLDFECRSFLQSQIRFMAGLVLEIGMGKHSPQAIAEAYETGQIPGNFRVAPPQGLVLMRVEY